MFNEATLEDLEFLLRCLVFLLWIPRSYQRILHEESHRVEYVSGSLKIWSSFVRRV